MSDTTNATDPLLGERFGYRRAVAKIRGEEVLDVLVAHARASDSGCTCGWLKLGRRYSRHLADTLADWLTTQERTVADTTRPRSRLVRPQHTAPETAQAVGERTEGTRGDG